MSGSLLCPPILLRGGVYLHFFRIQSLTCRSGRLIHWPWLKVTMEPSMDCRERCSQAQPGLIAPPPRVGDTGSKGGIRRTGVAPRGHSHARRPREGSAPGRGGEQRVPSAASRRAQSPCCLQSLCRDAGGHQRAGPQGSDFGLQGLPKGTPGPEEVAQVNGTPRG